uniref:Uncharacterized protein n=1 Tax=Chromera velia CCMP2878 TaxID=1169474 RepID=A0A0G4G872_9ALVE|eukprot:Cvel_20699.t1-p1 / transcript=Cvel_20699.t1 / gene=Cvel_20699 / organism=Chromera_velia_CCMP2878 / gene_product=hypothetical protein / transcript_product=hypothetical protein / location=Cvel_scaffold1883:20429-20965(-) / protein_length=179 / sequence_SO=supercontig / SO=protein_coding / is_pseudo=false
MTFTDAPMKKQAELGLIIHAGTAGGPNAEFMEVIESVVTDPDAPPARKEILDALQKHYLPDITKRRLDVQKRFKAFREQHNHKLHQHVEAWKQLMHDCKEVNYDPSDSNQFFTLVAFVADKHKHRLLDGLTAKDVTSILDCLDVLAKQESILSSTATRTARADGWCCRSSSSSWSAGRD